MLLHTRIFARTSPENKVQVIQAHIAKGLIVGMCGDGGNDCGALRAAHAGVALSEAEASVVSPFTARTKSAMSVVDLHREGRASLANSFASYKFLITYGQLFSVLKLICFYYGVIMPMMDYVMIDGVAVLCLSYAMTLSRPVAVLPPDRPTSSLLGPTSLCSVIGMQGINVAVIFAALAISAADPAYVRFPAEFAKGGLWWTLGDSWETSVLFVVVYSQFVTSAVIFSFGHKFRQPVYQNFALFGFWVLAYGFTSYLCLTDPNGVTDTFHIASRAFNSNATGPSPAWEGLLGEGNPAPAMSSDLRFRLWLLTLGGMAATALWEFGVVLGPVRDYCMAQSPPDRVKFKF